MKKHNLTWMVLASILVFTACKRGEDDPFISLRSRDAKLTGNWKLTDMFVLMEETDLLHHSFFPDSIASDYSYVADMENGILTLRGEYSDGDLYSTFSSVDRFSVETTLSIEKGGTYIYTEKLEQLSSKYSFWWYDYSQGTHVKVEVDSSNVDFRTEVTYAGYWHWKDNDKSKAMVSFDHLGDHYLLELRNNVMAWEYAGGMLEETEQASFLAKWKAVEYSTMRWEKQ